jgi:hypothetical protein
MRNILFFLTLLALTLPAAAQTRGGFRPDQAVPLPSRPLPKSGDLLGWDVLGRVDFKMTPERYVPQFSPEIKALDGKEVRIAGFMLPLEAGKKQKRILLTRMPVTCTFCLPGGGPESVIEVHLRKPLDYTWEGVVLSGRLMLLPDDPTSLFYRLVDAAQVTP